MCDITGITCKEIQYKANKMQDDQSDCNISKVEEDNQVRRRSDLTQALHYAVLWR